MMIERKQTLVVSFNEQDIPRLEPYLLHGRIYEDLRLKEEQLQMIQLNGVTRSLYRRPPEAADCLDRPPWNVVKRCWIASAMAPEADLFGGGVSPRTDRGTLGEFAEAGMNTPILCMFMVCAMEVPCLPSLNMNDAFRTEGHHIEEYLLSMGLDEKLGIAKERGNERGANRPYFGCSI
ncbi:hypothetical protein ANN_15592 [Periplaneta americana]|uniref:Uncharacterized protein n=1 Tax=Periplaneta americana TaxID=6978 RepID=A0ABQ8SGS2_PERAM|nr:hypothetical protein ANN_15592 [Periplaneta americana]